MANCNIRGVLPNWLQELRGKLPVLLTANSNFDLELRQLDLQRNNICGVIPSSIGKLTNLLYLNLKDNQNLCGPLPVRVDKIESSVPSALQF